MTFKKYAIIAENLKANKNIQIELEARQHIFPPHDLKLTEEYEMTYYECEIYPSIVFRKKKDAYYIETKELVEKAKVDSYYVYLSVEQSFSRKELKFSLTEKYKRLIKRYVISSSPLVEIKECDGYFVLEIEFDLTNYKLVKNIMNEYKVPFFPLNKPKEISSTALSRKLSGGSWLISYKADGLHVLVIEDEKMNTVLYYSNGTIKDEEGNNTKMIKPLFVYEAELIGKKLYYFDCLMVFGQDVSFMKYSERMEYIKKNRKEIYPLEKFEFGKTPDFPYDGYVITNENRRESYKSKFITTVDLRYKNGMLLLENEKESKRIYSGEEKLVDDNIYEFTKDLVLIKERKDKDKANYKFPFDDDPLGNIISGKGIPTLRWRHNSIKRKMLMQIPKNYVLLDIGSGKGGDTNKWEFETVYAVDPDLQMRVKKDNVIPIREKAENIYKEIEYDAVSIFFVPWSEKFIDIIEKSKITVLAVMENPLDYECNIFSCKITDEINLRIPGSETATNVKETITNFKKVIAIIKEKGFDIEELKHNANFKNKEEQILSNFYRFYICRKNEL